MTMQPGVNCPHCGAVNPAGSAFCESCGKALPAAVPSTPRIVGDAAMPTTSAGRQMVSGELEKQTRRASLTLLVIGILQLVCGAIVVVMIANLKRPGVQISLPVLLVAQFCVAAVFIGLYFWARVSPLPATIVGLVIYLTLLTLNVVSSVSQFADTDRPRTGIGGLGIGILDIVIIVLLAQGIQAGIKHRRLLGQQTASLA